MKRLRPFVLILLLMPVSGAGEARAGLSFADTRFRLTYDALTLPAGEKMGLLGTSLLVDQEWRGPLRFEAGLGVYSAVEGERGGFFTGGLALNTRLQRAGWALEAGFFVGGGGGDAAPQGGGLMLRPHISVLRDFETFSAGLMASRVRFPNGEIDSSQVGIQIDIPMPLVFVEGTIEDADTAALVWRRFYIAPVVQWYNPRSGVKNTVGSPVSDKTRLIGIEAGRFLGASYFAFIESAGAMRGNADGYAEFLGGAGARFVLNERLALHLKGAVGGAGGGNVDTGGGVIFKGSGGLAFKMRPDLSLGLDYGVAEGLDGAFSATMTKAAFQYHLEMALPASNAPAFDLQALKQGRWALRPSVLRYVSSSRLRKAGPRDDPVDLFSLKMDRYILPAVYLSGQAGAAYRGGAGGYATGLFGLGAQKNWTRDMIVLGELLVGAGGGGGIASDGGGIVQPMLGLRYLVTEKQGIQVMAGRVMALEGRLDATVIDIGWVYLLNTLERLD
ncbi:MAG: hypothetical protein ACE5F7_00930 [Nitrospiria bacterium]